MAGPERFVVFSDLDGTLLDHDSYSWAPAAPALALLVARGVPLVIVTSKTRSEVLKLRRALGNTHPFIVENGAATVVPHGYFANGVPAALAGLTGVHRQTDRQGNTVYRPGPGRDRLQALAFRLRDTLGLDFTSFAELGTNGIASATGLSVEAAALANDRLASEPLQWRGDDADYQRFERAVREAGANCTRGGRFVHMLGPTDKADAALTLLSAFRTVCADRVTSIALGDAPNDLRMLETADIAVVVRGRHPHPMSLGAHARVVRPDEPGPAGWGEAICSILQPDSL